MRSSWSLTIRDGFGQTETTALIGNTPGAASSRVRWAGRCPASRSRSIDPASGAQGDEGEICIDLSGGRWI